MNEVDINGHRYRFGKIDTKKAFHVARRVVPVVAGLGEGGGFEKLAEALAALTDEQCDYVIDACMNVTQREQEGGKWAPVMRGANLMFDDMTMPEMIQLTMAVLQAKENLGDFFQGAAPA